MRSCLPWAHGEEASREEGSLCLPTAHLRFLEEARRQSNHEESKIVQEELKQEIGRMRLISPPPSITAAFLLSLLS